MSRSVGRTYSGAGEELQERDSAIHRHRTRKQEAPFRRCAQRMRLSFRSFAGIHPPISPLEQIERLDAHRTRILPLVPDMKADKPRAVVRLQSLRLLLRLVHPLLTPRPTLPYVERSIWLSFLGAERR